MKRYLGNKTAIAIFILPALILFTVMAFYPMCQIFVKSLTKWNGVSPAEFIGLKNFQRLLKDPIFYTSLKNGIIYALVQVVLQMVNPNYRQINVAAQRNDPDSVLAYYKKLIALRHAHEILSYGAYLPLWEEDEAVFAYLRVLEGQRWMVAANFSDQPVRRPWPQETGRPKTCLLGNVGQPPAQAGEDLYLLPWEAQIWTV